MAKQAAAPIERMAGSHPHKGRQIALEILTFLLFLLFSDYIWFGNPFS